MNRLFVDTSAIYAALDAQDTNHAASGRIWRRVVNDGDALHTTNYVVLETSALLQHRFGLAAVRRLQEAFVPRLSVEGVDSSLHNRGFEALILANRRRLTLVDCVSFAFMRAHGVVHAFAFDDDFARQGFELLRA